MQLSGGSRLHAKPTSKAREHRNVTRAPQPEPTTPNGRLHTSCEHSRGSKRETTAKARVLDVGCAHPGLACAPQRQAPTRTQSPRRRSQDDENLRPDRICDNRYIRMGTGAMTSHPVGPGRTWSHPVARGRTRSHPVVADRCNRCTGCAGALSVPGAVF